ncbi:MAG: ribonuclease P protein component 4 [Promethearchaeota archaeon]
MGKPKRYHSKRRKRHLLMQKAARERILYLMTRADAKFEEDPALSQYYIELARKLAMATKISIPREMKRRICHKCKHWLVPGKNVRYRINNRKNYGSFITVTCLECNNITRYIFKGNACRIETPPEPIKSPVPTSSEKRPESTPKTNSTQDRESKS